jgi:hypothetical protein
LGWNILESFGILLPFVYILRLYGIFCRHFGTFSPFWYFVSRKNLTTLAHAGNKWATSSPDNKNKAKKTFWWWVGAPTNGVLFLPNEVP